MKKITLTILLVIVLLTGATGLWWLIAGRSTPPRQQASVTAFLSGEVDSGFARARPPGEITFPADLGPHPAFQTEWWYYTGNLETVDGRPFGYQFTIFRRALSPESAVSAGIDGSDRSNWRTNQVYFAHFTISDIANDRFYDFEKFSRGAAGLAGASAVPYQVWIEDWGAREQADGTVTITAAAGEISLTLNLSQTRPPVLHGNRGLSVKGDEEGNASFYYSLVNQNSEGIITIGEERYQVSGHSWKDHEYSTNALGPETIGWDWFSLQFDDEAEHALMLFEIRREDGTIAAQSGGSWILPDGTAVDLTEEEVSIDVLDTWTSPKSGAEYPAGWRIQIPRIGLDLTGYPLMADQELTVSTIYWEGAVRFTGTLNEVPVEATGYIELTGYGQSRPGRV